MKKLTTLLLALFVTTGMALAQSNDASVDQEGDDHQAMIEQLGSSNTAYVDQTDGGGASNGDATADISQQGDGNNVNLLQRAFFGFPDQSNAFITQIGNNNSVEGTSPTSALYQNQPGGLIDAYMEGDNNTLYSLRSETQKNGNEFLLSIIGNSNDVGMAQEFATADVEIDGDENEVKVWQLSPGANWNTSVYNDANVDIYNGASFNEVDIDQDDGVSNRASYRIGAGNDNALKLEQKGSKNRSHVQVLSGADNNSTDLIQSGVNNRGLWVISGGSTDINELTGVTTGDDNNATGKISGGQNTINFTQTGSNNLIGLSGQWNAKDGVVIDGGFNTVDISQLSNMNQADVNVVGNNNVSSIIQN
jgi:hypothetical protein